MEPKIYTINGKRYIQKPLVLGQIAPLIAILEGRTIMDLSVQGIMAAFSDILPELFAIILIPDGETAGGKDVKAMEQEFRDEMDIDTALEVAADFLYCNPVSSIAIKLSGLTGAMRAMAGEMKRGGTGLET